MGKLNRTNDESGETSKRVTYRIIGYVENTFNAPTAVDMLLSAGNAILAVFQNAPTILLEITTLDFKKQRRLPITS